MTEKADIQSNTAAKETPDNPILNGVMWKAVLAFFFPILLGTFFQQLYNTVDAIIVGRFAGKVALASVGGASAHIINLVVGFFTGLTNGCSVVISNYYGAGDKKGLDNALHTSYAFSVAGGLVLGVTCYLLTPFILTVMNTPQEIMPYAELYIRVYFTGLMFTFIYNMGASILRALGDSKRPLYYLITCTIINIVLDLLLVAVFDLGVLGVALATLVSQAVSAGLVTECLMRRTPAVKLVLRKVRFYGHIFMRMMLIGLPAGIQASTYALSNMFIQSAVNSFGVNTVAGWTAEGKVDVIFWMINGSFGVATATVVGQNYGARNMERVKKGTRTCLIMALTSAIVISILLYNFGEYMLWIFCTEKAVVDIGAHLIRLLVPGYAFFVFIEIFSSSLRARGDTLIPTAINLLCIVGFRLRWVFAFGKAGSLDKIIYCYPLSWILCMVVMTVYYIFRTRKLQAV